MPGTFETRTWSPSMRTTPFCVPAQTTPWESTLIARMLPPGMPSAAA